jgi:hypothetical protein
MNVRAWIAAALFSAPCALPGMDPALNDLSVSNALGGRGVLEAIRGAAAVRAQRVDSVSSEVGSPPPDPSRLVPLGDPFPVPEKEAALLKKILTTNATFLAEPKRCKFRANVRYFFDGAPLPVSLVLCFGCAELQVWSDGQLLSFTPFDSAYPTLVEQARRLFPGDPLLASFHPTRFQDNNAPNGL